MTANQFPGFSITSTRIDNTNPEFKNSDAWRVTVKNPRGKTLSRKFYKGYGHKGAKPTLQEFMECMISDARCAEDYGSMEEFADNLGYERDTVSERRRVHRIYEACQKIATKLETFLTEEETAAFLNEED